MKKPIIKSKRKISIIAGSLATLVLAAGITYGISNTIIRNNNQIPAPTAVSLVENSASQEYAKKLGILDMLTKDENGNVVRFEAMQNKPIDIIVDEGSAWCMTDTVKAAIKLSIEQYNEVFSYINPEYSFRYITKEEYDKNPTSDPFIFVTTMLKIGSGSEQARAVTSPAEAEGSLFKNGAVDSSSTIIISSTGTIDLSVEEMSNVFSHEVAHALGYEKHAEDKESIMHPVANRATIASHYFSEDLLNMLMANYYNPKTNPRSYDEVAEYIKQHVTHRETDLQAYYNEHKEPTAQKGNDDIISQLKEQDKQIYINKIKNYAQKNNLNSGKIDEIVGSTYSQTSIYNQTITFTFNDDGTYILSVYSKDREITCQGTYEILNNIAVLTGKNFTVENMQYVSIDDTIFFTILDNGDCAYGAKSNNFSIKILNQVLENELTL